MVDDALTIRELQRSILERAGFDVRVATDGIHALTNLAEAPSDLVLTDIEMPNMDGFALTEAIRADPTSGQYPGADPQFPFQRRRPATWPRRRRGRIHPKEWIR